MMRPNDPRHGTANGYKNCGCRCDRCRDAILAYVKSRGISGYRKSVCECGQDKNYRSARCRVCNDVERMAEHGTESRYRGCRCDECRAASVAARRRRRAKAAA